MRLPPSNVDPELARLLEQAKARIAAMSPGELAELREDQRKSWVIGELMLEHPEMTREEAEYIYERGKAAR